MEMYDGRRQPTHRNSKQGKVSARGQGYFIARITKDIPDHGGWLLEQEN